jgi:hypothetical protein
MKKCETCRQLIVAGGVYEGGYLFCRKMCRDEFKKVPHPKLLAAVHQIRNGRCPECGGNGPIDVRISHRIWSLLIVFGRPRVERLACLKCGQRAKLLDSLFSFCLGWWSPPGLLFTPVQIARNLAGLLSPEGGNNEPSDLLLLHVRKGLTERSTE